MTAIWPAKVCTVISNTPNMQQLLRGLLHTLGWHIGRFTPNLQDAYDDLVNQKSCLTLIDDSTDLPSPTILRKFFSIPAVFCTPIICFLSEKTVKEAAMLSKINTLEIIKKPIIPNNFSQLFKDFSKKWEEPVFNTLRSSFYKSLSIKEPNAKIAFLAQLSQLNPIRSTVAMTLAHELFYNGFPKNAEQILLNALKTPPFNPAALIKLADLYMHSHMPEMAYQFFSNLTKKYPEVIFLHLDLVQALVLMDRYGEAIDTLKFLINKEYDLVETIPFYIQSLMAEGREEEALEAAKKWKTICKKIQMAWAHKVS